MAKVVITMNLDDELADPGHRTGVTEAAYGAITDALSPLGTDIEVRPA